MASEPNSLIYFRISHIFALHSKYNFSIKLFQRHGVRTEKPNNYKFQFRLLYTKLFEFQFEIQMNSVAIVLLYMYISMYAHGQYTILM